MGSWSSSPPARVARRCLSGSRPRAFTHARPDSPPSSGTCTSSPTPCSSCSPAPRSPSRVARVLSTHRNRPGRRRRSRLGRRLDRRTIRPTGTFGAAPVSYARARPVRPPRWRECLSRSVLLAWPLDCRRERVAFRHGASLWQLVCHRPHAGRRACPFHVAGGRVSTQSGDTCVRWLGSAEEVIRSLVNVAFAAGSRLNQMGQGPWLREGDLAPAHWFTPVGPSAVLHGDVGPSAGP